MSSFGCGDRVWCGPLQARKCTVTSLSCRRVTSGFCKTRPLFRKFSKRFLIPFSAHPPGTPPAKSFRINTRTPMRNYASVRATMSSLCASIHTVYAYSYRQNPLVQGVSYRKTDSLCSDLLRFLAPPCNEFFNAHLAVTDRVLVTCNVIATFA